jgi:hypothetical protein
MHLRLPGISSASLWHPDPTFSSQIIASTILSRSIAPAQLHRPPHHCQHFQGILQPPLHRSYQHSTASSPHNSRSHFKILPFIIILAIGSGSYVLLVTSRASARSSQTQQEEQE